MRSNQGLSMSSSLQRTDSGPLLRARDQMVTPAIGAIVEPTPEASVLTPSLDTRLLHSIWLRLEQDLPSRLLAKLPEHVLQYEWIRNYLVPLWLGEISKLLEEFDQSESS